MLPAVHVTTGMCDNCPGALSGSDAPQGGGVVLEEMASSDCLSDEQALGSLILQTEVCGKPYCNLWETSPVKDPKCVSDI